MKNLPIHREDDKGFTLIELMVVVLIIAILLAIAIPTFLGAQNKAKDRSAQSSIRNALTNAKTLYADTGSYTAATQSALSTSEPSLTFLMGVSTGPKSVSILDGTGTTTWVAAVKSETGQCFYIQDSVAAVGGGTKYGKATIGAGVTCVASEAAAAATLANW